MAKLQCVSVSSAHGELLTNLSAIMYNFLGPMGSAGCAIDRFLLIRLLYTVCVALCGVQQTVPRTSRSLFGGQQSNHCVSGGNSTVGRATLATLSLVSVVSVVLTACPSHLPAARLVITVPPSFDLGSLMSTQPSAGFLW